MSMSEVSVQLSCPICLAGNVKVVRRYGRLAHKLPERAWEDRYTGLAQLKAEGQPAFFDEDGFRPCPDWDEEFRHVSEPFGFFSFAWWPRECRNGKRRWLTSVEHHQDGTFTLGNRAH